MHDRLRAARAKAGFDSARSAALRFGWSISTYAAHENGQNKFKGPQAAEYARRFKTSAAWLLTGEGLDSPINIFKVVGLVGLGEHVEMLTASPTSPLEEIELPFGFNLENAAALLCRGHSMTPRINDGEIVIYQRDSQTPEQLIGQDAVVGLEDGRVMIKTIRKGSAPNIWRLTSHNFPEIEDVKIEWCGELLAIIPKGKWRHIS